MKKIILVFLITFSAYLGAQLSVIKDVTGASEECLSPSLVNPFKKNGLVYYFGRGSSTNFEIISTDGTASGTQVAATLPKPYSNTAIQSIVPTPDFFYFNTVTLVTTTSPAYFNYQLWRSDGTQTGTFLLKDFGNLPVGTPALKITSDEDFVNNYGVVGDTLFFAAYSPTEGYELWKSDGTVAGTFLLKDIKPGTGHSYPGGFSKIGNTVYFIATETGVWRKLWKTDGTPNGTEVIDVPNLNIGSINHMTPVNNKLIFFGIDSYGIEPWVSDGTIAGTFMLKETNVGTSNMYTLRRFVLKKNASKVIFEGMSATGLNLWVTDGTTNGTVQVMPDGSVQSGNPSTNPEYAIDDKRFFLFNNSTNKLQSVDFENNNLYFEIDIPTYSTGTGSASNLFILNGTLWFNSQSPVYWDELYRSDGTQANTSMVFDIFPPTIGTSSSSPHGFFTLNNNLYFFAKPNMPTMNFYKFVGDYTFNGSANSNWNNPTNWNSTLTPTFNDLVTIPPGFNVTVDANGYANNLIVNSPINLATGNLNVSGNLDLGAKVTLNNNNLVLKGSNSLITNGDSTNYILTNGTGTVNVENLNATRGTVNIPIGTSANYNPVAISNAGTSDSFSARVSDGISNTTNGAVNATWDISEGTAGGSNVNLSLGWNQSQENPSFARTAAKVGHYQNGSWIEENSGTVSGTNPYTISASGINSFSPFSVMNFAALATVDLQKKDISVYPNPFSDNLNILMPENGMVNIYDLSGKLVSTEFLKKGINILEKSSLVKGTYVYEIKNSRSERVSSGKIIKR